MRVRASSSVAAAAIDGLLDRRQLVLPARCPKSNVAELRLYKVCWQIQPRNWELASPASKTRRNVSVDLTCAFLMPAIRLIDTRDASPKGGYVN